MPQKYLAAIEVDQRQRIITSADRLKEMLGGSWNIQETTDLVSEAIAGSANTEIVLPVSGAVWLYSTDLAELEEVLWKCRAAIVERLDLPCTFAIKAYSDFDSVQAEINARMRSLKDAKTAEAGLPALPFFASCRIQPQLGANHWIPENESKEQTWRRALTSKASRYRRQIGNKTLHRFLRQFHTKGFAGPWRLDDMVASSSDQFLALIKADGDGMTSLVSDIPWISAAEKRGVTPEALMHSFSRAVESCIWRALVLAVNSILPAKKGGYFPVVPIVRAGEDTVLICRRDFAVDLACRFGNAYQKLAEEDKTLRELAAEARAPEKHALSLSFGILFAKKGYPFEIMWELAEDLQKSAKRTRARENSKTGWIDCFWLASSARIDIDESRRESLSIQDGSELFRLTTRPWSLDQAKRVLTAACNLRGLIPESKWVALETVVRLGKELSNHAYRAWLLRLTQDQQNALIRELQKLGDLAPPEPWISPWIARTIAGQTFAATPLLDIAEIMNTL